MKSVSNKGGHTSSRIHEGLVNADICNNVMICIKLQKNTVKAFILVLSGFVYTWADDRRCRCVSGSTELMAVISDLLSVMLSQYSLHASSINVLSLLVSSSNFSQFTFKSASVKAPQPVSLKNIFLLS